MQQAVNLGNRIIMMNRGQVLHDIQRLGTKNVCVPEDLIDRFEEVRRREQLDESAAEDAAGQLRLKLRLSRSGRFTKPGPAGKDAYRATSRSRGR